MPFLFLTAIDNRYPLLAGGRRVDQMDRCGHYARWEDDFALARALGCTALRYGPAYYRTHLAPDRVEWESCEEPMERLRESGLEVIGELCHSGVPTWLDGFRDPAFPVLFAHYARAFARRFPWVRYYTPISDIQATAMRSALRGWWNERATGEAAFLRTLRNLCMAHELAVEAILAERPDAVFVHGERMERFHPMGESARRDAERLNWLRFLGLDLTFGHELAPGMARMLHDAGITSNDLSFFRERRAVGQRWLGVDYDAGAEQRVAANGRRTAARASYGFRALVGEYHRRYRAPVLVRGTHHAGIPAAEWTRARWEDVLALLGAGVPVTGFGWSTLTDQVDGEHALRVARGDVHPVGLVDLGRRLRPAGEAFRRVALRWADVLDRGDEDRTAGAVGATA